MSGVEVRLKLGHPWNFEQDPEDEDVKGEDPSSITAAVVRRKVGKTETMNHILRM